MSFIAPGGGGYHRDGGGGGGGSVVNGLFGDVAQGGSQDSQDGRVSIKQITQTLADAFLTSCGAVGRRGPTEENCRQVYAQTAAGQLLDHVSEGVQTFKIPQTGTYRISAYGARGGNAQSDNWRYQGGYGALSWGTFKLSKGDELHVVVGQSGNHRPPSSSSINSDGGGGGGGTFVWINNEPEPLVVAGGGGGVFLLCM